MLKEGQEVRIRATGEVGAVVEFDPDTGICMVEKTIDLARNDGPAMCELGIADIVELTEAPTRMRKDVSERFDLAVFASSAWIDMASCSNLVIRKIDDGVSVRAYNLFGEIDEERLLGDEEAQGLLGKFGKMRSYRWDKDFQPRNPVLDGYSWALEVYSGATYYRCTGSNAEPEELAEFLACIPEFGLPAVWSDDGPFMDVPYEEG